MEEPLFSSDLSGPQAQGAATVAPVEAVNYGSLFKTGANLVDGLFKIKEQQDKADLETRKNSAITEFVNEHNRLSAAKAAGQINDAQYNVRSQATFRQFAANNPEAIDELKKTAAGLKEFGGLGDVQDEVQAVKTDFRTSVASAQKDGFEVSLSDPIEHQQLVVKQHRQYLLNKRLFEEKKAIRAEEREMARFAREEVEYTNKVEARQTLTSMVENGLPILNSLADMISKEWPGASAERQQELMMRWDREQTKWKSNIAIVSQGDSSMASAVNSMVTDIDSRFRNLLSGKESAEFFKNRNNTYLDIARGQILSDPKSARFIAQIQWAPNAIAEILKHTTDPSIVRNTLGNLADPSAPLNMNNKEEVKVTVDSFIKLYNDPKLDEKGKADLFKNTGNNILRGLGNAIVSGGDKFAVKEALNFIKNPAFVDNISNMDQGAYNAARQAVTAYYNNPVVVDLIDKFNRPMNPPLSNRTPLQAMDIQVSDSGVKLVQKGIYDPMAQFFVRASEQALSDLIITNAHLDGTKNYAAYWEKNKRYLFPEWYGNPDILNVGDIVNGKKFLGGMVNDPKNWQPVGQNYSEGDIGGRPTERANFSSGKIGGAPTTKPTTSVGKIQ